MKPIRSLSTKKKLKSSIPIKSANPTTIDPDMRSIANFHQHHQLSAFTSFQHTNNNPLSKNTPRKRKNPAPITVDAPADVQYAHFKNSHR